jgi:hypothetical protein
MLSSIESKISKGLPCHTYGIIIQSKWGLKIGKDPKHGITFDTIFLTVVGNKTFLKI